MGAIIAKMNHFIQKIIPRFRYTIFTGTNSFKEWLLMLEEFIFASPYQDNTKISQYENSFAKTCSVKHGISFGAGRMALYSILKAMGISENDEIIIPAFTCVVVPNAMLYMGIKPVYVDIDPVFFNIDPAKVEAAITKRTKALYAQHTFGVVCNIDALKTIASKYNLPIIEDAAHALGAVYNNKPAGSLTEVAFFSTDHSKVINTHLGGIAVTNDDELALRLRAIQQESPFLETKVVRKLICSFLIEYLFFLPFIFWLGRFLIAAFHRFGFFFFFIDELKTIKPINYPYPCRMSSAQARLGLSQLDSLQLNLTHRREMVKMFEENIRWTGLAQNDINNGAWLRYSFMVKDRSKFEAALNNHFELGTWFTSVVGGRTKNLEQVGYFEGSCPVAEAVVKHVVNLPTHKKIPIIKMKKYFGQNLNWLSKEVFWLNR